MATDDFITDFLWLETGICSFHLSHLLKENMVNTIEWELCILMDPERDSSHFPLMKWNFWHSPGHLDENWTELS